MLGVWFIICVIFLTVFRYIWKRKENNPCMLFSYFLYLYDVTGTSDEFVYVLGNVDPVISSKWRMGDQRGILYYVISGKCFLYGDEKAAGIHLGNAYASEYCRLLCLYYMYDRCKIR